MTKLTGAQVEVVAERAACSTKTVRRYLGGGHLHRHSVSRIERALRELGHDDALRADERHTDPAAA